MAQHTLHKLRDRDIRHAQGPKVLIDGGNLRVRVNKKDQAYFFVRYALNLKTYEVPLGRYPTVSLKDARERAAQARRWLAEKPKRNPKVEWAAEAAALIDVDTQRPSTVIFSEFATPFIEILNEGWKTDESRKQWLSSLQNHAGEIWNAPIDSVDFEMVRRCISPIWVSINPTAKRVCQRIEKILNAAKVEKLYFGENPAVVRGNLEFVLPSHHHTVTPHPSAPYSSIPEVWEKLEESEAFSTKIIQFGILTAGRSIEVRGARWDEIDFEKRIWNVRANRMKRGKLHNVPLSDAAIELLSTIPRGMHTALVFPSPDTSVEYAGRSLNKYLNKLNIRDPDGKFATFHGMRNSFSDYIGDETDFSPESVEFSLAHVPSKTRGAYRRMRSLEKRAILMNHWGQYCLGQVSLADFENSLAA